MSTPRDAIPSQKFFFAPMLRSLRELGGSASIGEIDDKVAEVLQLSDEARAVKRAGSSLPLFAYRSAWSRSWLKNAGLTNNSERGIWSLTPAAVPWEGATEEEIIRFVQAAAAALRKRTSVPKTVIGSATESVPIEEAEEDTGEASSESEVESLTWTDRLLGLLQAMKSDAFERLSQRVLRESGFTKVEVTGRSGDGGIDGTGVLRVNLLSFHVLFQCKKYTGSVGSPAVRDFRGAMVGRADKGLIITTGTFTADARREAVRDGAPAIDLIDGASLCELLKDLRIGVSVRTVEEVTVDDAAFDGF